MVGRKNVIRFILGTGLLALGLFGLAVSGAAQFSALDLVVVSLTTEPVDPEPGMAVTLVATIANSGREDVLQGFNVRFKMDGVFIADRRLNFGLDANRQQQVLAPWSATEGDHVFRIEIDPFNDVEESNEFNNNADYAFGVKLPGAMRSVTFDVVDAIGAGLKNAGTEIQLEYSTDTLALLNTFQKAFQVASDAFSAAASKSANLTSALPSNLLSEPQVVTSQTFNSSYIDIAESFKIISDGLLNFNLQGIPAALEQVIAEMDKLADQSIEGISFEALAQTVPLFQDALEQAKLLQDALAGKQVNVNAVTQELVNLLDQIGQIWIDLGTSSIAAAEAQTPHRQNTQGQSVISYRAGEEVTISAEGATQLKLEVFDKEGKLVYSRETEGSEILWNGIGNDGKTLAPGRYYGRLIITAPEEKTYTDLIQITIG